MSIDSGEANQLQRALAQSIREHWVLFLIEGIVLVVLGLLAIIIPPIATIAVTIFLGWLFLISKIIGLVTTFWARHAPGSPRFVNPIRKEDALRRKRRAEPMSVWMNWSSDQELKTTRRIKGSPGIHPVCDVIDHGADGAGREPAPQDAQQHRGIGALDEVLID